MLVKFVSCNIHSSVAIYEATKDTVPTSNQIRSLLSNLLRIKGILSSYAVRLPFADLTFMNIRTCVPYHHMFACVCIAFTYIYITCT